MQTPLNSNPELKNLLDSIENRPRPDLKEFMVKHFLTQDTASEGMSTVSEISNRLEADVTRQLKDSIDSGGYEAERLFQEGKLYFEKGFYDKALESWRKLAEHTDNPTLVRQWVEEVKNNFERNKSAQAELQRTLGVVSRQSVHPSDHVQRILYSLSQELKGELALAEEFFTRKQVSLAQRQEALKKDLDRVRQALISRDFNAAMEYCSSIENPSSEIAVVRAEIHENQTRQRKIAQLKEALREVESQANLGTVFPQNISQVLNAVSKELAGELQRMEAEAQNAQIALEKRNTGISQSLEAIKVNIEKRRWDDALLALESVAPLLDNAIEVAGRFREILFFESGIQKAQKEIASFKDSLSSRMRLPEPLVMVLEEARRHLQSGFELAKDDLGLVRTLFEQKESHRAQSLSQSQSFLAQGKIRESLSALTPVLSDFENPSLIKEAFEKVIELERISTEQSKSLSELQEKLALKAAVPQGLVQGLGKLKDTLTLKTQDLSAHLEKIQNQAKEKLFFFQSTLKELENFLSQGKLKESLAAFQSLEPLLEDSRVLRTRLEEMAEVEAKSFRLKESIAGLEQALTQKLLMPASIQGNLFHLEASLKENHAQLNRTLAETREKFENKESHRAQSLAQAQSFLAQGKLRESFEALLPALNEFENSSLVREAYERVIQLESKSVELSRFLADLESRLGLKIQTPQDLVRNLDALHQSLALKVEALSDQIGKVKTQINDASDRRVLGLSQSQSFLAQGKIRESLSALTPVLSDFENPSLIKEAFEKVIELERISTEQSKSLSELQEKLALKAQIPAAMLSELTHLRETLSLELRTLQTTLEETQIELDQRNADFYRGFSELETQIKNRQIQAGLEALKNIAHFFDNSQALENLLKDILAKEEQVRSSSEDLGDLRKELASIWRVPVKLQQEITNLHSSVSTASADLEAQIAQTRRSIEQKNQSLIEGLNQLDVHLAAGRFEEAGKVFALIQSHFENAPELQKRLETIELTNREIPRLRELLEAESQALLKKGQLPESLEAQLVDAETGFVRRQFEIQNALSDVREKLAQKNQILQKAFSDSQAFIEKGDLRAALVCLEPELGLIENAEGLREAFNILFDLEGQTSREAEKAAGLEKQLAELHDLPESLASALVSYEQKFNFQKRTLLEQIENLERRNHQKQELCRTHLDETEASIAEGRFEDAVDCFRKAAPFTANSEAVLSRLSGLAALSSKISLLSHEKGVLEEAGRSKAMLPAAVEHRLGELDENFHQKERELEESLKEERTSFEKKESTRAQVLAESQSLLAQGKLAQSFEILKPRLEEFEDSQLIRNAFESIIRLEEKTGLQSKELELLKNKSSIKPPSPQSLLKGVSELELTLSSQTHALSENLEKIQKQSKEKQEFFQNSLKELESFLSQGKLKESLIVFQALEPLLEDSKNLRSRLEEAIGLAEKEVALKRQVEQAETSLQSRMKAPNLLDAAVSKAKTAHQTKLKTVESRLSKVQDVLMHHRRRFTEACEEITTLVNQGQYESALEVVRKNLSELVEKPEELEKSIQAMIRMRDDAQSKSSELENLQRSSLKREPATEDLMETIQKSTESFRQELEKINAQFETSIPEVPTAPAEMAKIVESPSFKEYELPPDENVEASNENPEHFSYEIAPIEAAPAPQASEPQNETDRIISSLWFAGILAVLFFAGIMIYFR